MSDPASIRYNNPGAMWGKGNPVATKFGANQTIGLNDGLGQGNNIAVFPDKVHGAAAQFALWARGYTNMTLAEAIHKWSGGNSSTSYMSSLTAKTGLSPSSQITMSVLTSPTGLKLMKAQAAWEAGRAYPMTDDEWIEAQKLAFGSGEVKQPAPLQHQPAPVKPAPAAPESVLGKAWDWLRKH